MSVTLKISFGTTFSAGIRNSEEVDTVPDLQIVGVFAWVQLHSNFRTFGLSVRGLLRSMESAPLKTISLLLGTIR